MFDDRPLPIPFKPVKGSFRLKQGVLYVVKQTRRHPGGEWYDEYSVIDIRRVMSPYWHERKINIVGVYAPSSMHCFRVGNAYVPGQRLLEAFDVYDQVSAYRVESTHCMPGGH